MDSWLMTSQFLASGPLKWEGDKMKAGVFGEGENMSAQDRGKAFCNLILAVLFSYLGQYFSSLSPFFFLGTPFSLNLAL